MAALVSGSPSLLTVADLSSGTLVYCAPMLSAVSMGQGSLVSRLPAASGAVSCPEALVSRSLASFAATTRSTPLVGDVFMLLSSILPYCCVPITLQACHLHLPTSEHLNSDLAV